jgi:hypothetical protein
VDCGAGLTMRLPFVCRAGVPGPKRKGRKQTLVAGQGQLPFPTRWIICYGARPDDGE